MHQQIRTVPARSPADLQALLEVLAENRINIQAAGGRNIETGGEFAFGLVDGEYERAMEVLTKAGYDPHLVDIDYCALNDEPGQLLRCVSEIRERNLLAGQVILEIAVGVPDAEGCIQVQVYSGDP
jgi:hypothetical protein